VEAIFNAIDKQRKEVNMIYLLEYRGELFLTRNGALASRLKDQGYCMAIIPYSSELATRYKIIQ